MTRFYFKDLEIVGGPFDTFYDNSIEQDTVFWRYFDPDQEYGVQLDTIQLWGEARLIQKWYYSFSYFVTFAHDYVTTAYGIGPVSIYGYDGGEWGSKTKTNTLIGALIDGIFYGDSVMTVVIDNKVELLHKYSLSQNYPNPFNPTTTIKFTIPTSPLNPSPYQGEGNRERLIALKVYDVLGNEIETLVNEEQPAGEYEVEFDGTGLPSGIYFYQLRTGNYIETKKMVLIK
jgi:hypothetical protein